jgi:YD repeat-containing protein
LKVETSSIFQPRIDKAVTLTQGSNVTDITYDFAGRKTELDDPDMGEWSYSYDALGNLTSQTDARGCTTSMTYDDLSRLTGKTYTGPGSCDSTPDVTYTYDQGTYGKGRRTAMSDGSGSTSWTYDNRGRVTEKTRDILPGDWMVISRSPVIMMEMG